MHAEVEILPLSFFMHLVHMSQRCRAFFSKRVFLIAVSGLHVSVIETRNATTIPTMFTLGSEQQTNLIRDTTIDH